MGIGQWLVLRQQVSLADRWKLVNTVVIVILFVVAAGVFLSPLDEADYSQFSSPQMKKDEDFLFFLARVLAVYSPIAGSVLVWMIKNGTTTRERVLISVAGIVSGGMIGWLIGTIIQ